jgi:Spy/CpxP family protein refolding chaperone
MNRIHLLVMGTVLLFATAVFAAQPANDNGATKDMPAAHAVVPTPEEQMRLLTPRLDLTTEQQEKIKPILQDLHDATVKIVQDETLSQQERMQKVGEWRYKTDASIRAILNDDQKKKLNQVESEPHAELHGNVKGAASQH